MGEQTFCCWSQVSMLASAVLDNIPWTTVMVKVVQRLAFTSHGLRVPALGWALSLGACLGGNSTLIASSANIVVVRIASA